MEKDYSIYHRKQLLRRIPYNIKKAQKGMIFEVWYKDLNNEVNKYYILILNPKYRFPGEKEWKIHAIKLNHFPVTALNLLAETYGIKFIPLLQRFKMLDVTKFVQEVSSQRFYRSEIKMLMKRFPSYRTFFYDKFVKSNLVDYKYDDKIEKKYLTEYIEPTTPERHNVDKSEEVSDKNELLDSKK